MDCSEDLFIIDTKQDQNLLEGNSDAAQFLSSSRFQLIKDQETKKSLKVPLPQNENEDIEYYFGLPPPSVKLSDIIDISYITNKTSCFKGQKDESKNFDETLNGLNSLLNSMKPKSYSFITDGLEAKNSIKEMGLSDSRLKKLNKKLRDKTKGGKWFDMKAPEMTEELKNEMQVLQMRSAINPKHFYKRSEMKAIPKYFEIGKVIESPVEYHGSKNISKKSKTLVDELMEDAEFQQFNKRKYQEVIEHKKNEGYQRALKKMRKLKKKKV
ncbi:unnamed protein product [Diamesa serratosioi]